MTQEEMQCYYHPGVATSLSCANCGKPICPKDLIETPVGAKCKECGTPSKKMRGVAKPSQYAMAAVYGLAAAIVGGLIAGELTYLLQVGFIISLALGYLIGEAVSRGAHRRADTHFEIMAGAFAFVAIVVSGEFGDIFVAFSGKAPQLSADFFSLVETAIAVAAAIFRVRG